MKFDNIQDILNELKIKTSDAEQNGDDKDYASWQFQEGVLISVNMSNAIIDHIIELNAKHEQYINNLKIKITDKIYEKSGIFPEMSPEQYGYDVACAYILEVIKEVMK